MQQPFPDYDLFPDPDEDESTPNGRRIGCAILFILAFAFFGLLAVAFYATTAAAHQTASGIFYPPRCCSNKDCKPAPPGSVRVMADGYHITETGEVVPFGDKRIKEALDTDMHLCQQGGDFDKGRVLCLFPPLEGF